MPAWSGTFALWTRASSTRPSVSTSRYLFVPLTFLPAIEAPLLAAHAGSLGRLRVDDASARLVLPAKLAAQALAEAAVERLPGTFQAPYPEVMKDRLPRRKVPRQQHPLLTTTLQDVEDGIKDLAIARTVQPRAPTPFRGREVRLEQCPPPLV